MTRDQAFEAMKQGKKISHRYFAEGEHYKIINGRIIAEDGVNHTAVFWNEDGKNWRADGWYVIN